MEPLIFSLDPGVSKMGWALTNYDGKTIDYGFWTDPLNAKFAFNKRMNRQIHALITHFTTQLDKNVKRVVWEVVPAFGQMQNKDLVQATCITLKVLTFQRGLEYQEYQARSWHKLFLGKASCTKEEVKSKVLESESISDDVTYDVYDAIAIGKVSAREDKWDYFNDLP